MSTETKKPSIRLRDFGSEQYLDGIECRYSIECGDEWPHSEPLAYVFDLAIAERIVNALNESREPVAWQYRIRTMPDGEWSEWREGRKPQLRGDSYEAQERQLFAALEPVKNE